MSPGITPKPGDPELRGAFRALIDKGLTYLDILDVMSEARPEMLDLGSFLNTKAKFRSDEECAYVDAARERRQRDGVLEVDDNAAVSLGCDKGAYVLAWVWVTDEEAGIENHEEEA